MRILRYLVLVVATLAVTFGGSVRALAHACPEMGVVLTSCCCGEKARDAGPTVKRDHAGCCDTTASLVDDGVLTHLTTADAGPVGIVLPSHQAPPRARPRATKDRPVAPAGPRAPPMSSGAERRARYRTYLL